MKRLPDERSANPRALAIRISLVTSRWAMTNTGVTPQTLPKPETNGYFPIQIAPAPWVDPLIGSGRWQPDAVGLVCDLPYTIRVAIPAASVFHYPHQFEPIV